MRRKTVAVYGGAFNPVHSGHMALAVHILKEGFADQVAFLPSFNPPHKAIGSMAPFEKRCEMLELAIYEEYEKYAWHGDELQICKLESEMEGITYTLKVLDELSHRWLDKDFKMVIGADELAQLHTWRPDPVRLVRSYDFLCFPREDVPLDLTEMNKDWPGWLCKKLLQGIIFDAPMLDVSSSAVRASTKLLGHCPMNAKVPEPVRNYIDYNRLYMEEEDDTSTGTH